MQVVITGIGVVTPLGSDLEAFWSALLRGESGLRPVESFDTSAYNVRLGGEVRDFAFDVADSNLDPSTMGRASQFAVAASRRALVDAGLEPHRLDAPRTGVSMGTTSGEPLEVERMNDELMAGRQASLGPALATRYPCHSIAAAIAADLGVAGPNTMIPTACAAGNYAWEPSPRSVANPSTEIARVWCPAKVPRSWSSSRPSGQGVGALESTPSSRDTACRAMPTT